MLRKVLICLMLIFLAGSVSAIKITEVEANPAGTDTGKEWVEIYSDEEINLDGWKLVNNDGNEFELNGSFEGYFIIELKTQWLDNSEEKVSLYNGANLEDETKVFDDSGNDDKTWQYCTGWNFVGATKGKESDCGSGSQEDEDNSNADEEEPADETPASDDEEDSAPEDEEDESEKDDGKINLITGNSVAQNDDDDGSEVQSKRVINLNSPKQGSESGSKTVYESKNERIKNYAIYGFIGFLVLVIIVLLIKR